MWWDTQNMLESNVEKTEAILFTPCFIKTLNNEKLSFANTIIQLPERVCDFGVKLFR